MFDGTNRICRDGLSGDIDVLLAEDDPVIRGITIEMLGAVLGGKIRSVVWTSAAKDIEKYRALNGSQVLLTDLTLDDGELDIESMESALRVGETRVGWVIMSGWDPSVIRKRLKDTEQALLRVDFLQKPFRVAALKQVVGNMLDYVEGKDGIEDEALANDVPKKPEEVWKEPLINFRNLGDLVSVLPEESLQVQSPNAAYDLCGLVANEFENLQMLAGESFEIFYARWRECFPTDNGASRRKCLLGILRELNAAEYVLDICIHDINNILTRFNGDGPSASEWLGVVAEVRAIIERSRAPFAAYHANPVDEHAFWERQSIDEVSDRVSRHFSTIGMDLPPDAAVYCPAGTLWSVLETFYSNFAKVKKSTGQEDARLDLFVYTYDGKIVFQISDNIRELGDDQLEKLFEEGIRSDPVDHGMGTGLARTADIIRDAGGAVGSYHYRSASRRWVRKKPHQEIELVDSNDVPLMPSGMRKVFEFILPLVNGK